MHSRLMVGLALFATALTAPAQRKPAAPAPERRARALTRLQRYVGLVPGSTPLTELAFHPSFCEAAPGSARARQEIVEWRRERLLPCAGLSREQARRVSAYSQL